MTESDNPMRNSVVIANVAAGRKDRNLDVAKVIRLQGPEDTVAGVAEAGHDIEA